MLVTRSQNYLRSEMSRMLLRRRNSFRVSLNQMFRFGIMLCACSAQQYRAGFNYNLKENQVK